MTGRRAKQRAAVFLGAAALAAVLPVALPRWNVFAQMQDRMVFNVGPVVAYLLQWPLLWALITLLAYGILSVSLRRIPRVIGSIRLSGLAIGSIAALPLAIATWLLAPPAARFETAWLSALLIGPIAEELFFRGVLLGRSAGSGARARTLQVLVAGIAFGLAHASASPGQILGATAFGLIQGWLFLASGRDLGLVILMHVAFNYAALFATEVPIDTTGGAFLGFARVLTLGMAVGAVAISARLRQRR